MIRINEGIKVMTKKNSRKEVAEKLEVTEALLSTWAQKDNDFSPRFALAKKIYKHYNLVIYPYAEEALNEQA